MEKIHERSGQKISCHCPFKFVMVYASLRPLMVSSWFRLNRTLASPVVSNSLKYEMVQVRGADFHFYVEKLETVNYT